MTNFEAINGLRALIAEHGDLVPELAAHNYAGITRQRWNEIRRVRRVPVLIHVAVEYVPLTWIEQRPTSGGRQGLLSRIRKGQTIPAASDIVQLSRQKLSRSQDSYREGFHKKNGSNKPTIQKRKARNTHATPGIHLVQKQKGK